jgi:hypothetical protein
MAEVPTSIAISPSGGTLLNAMQVTTSAGTVLNEVVTIGDYASAQVASVLAEGALLIEPGGTNTQPVTGTFFPSVQTVAGTVAISAFPATQTVAGSVTIGSPLGQAAMAASIPVVVASNQATFPVTVTFPATQTVTGAVTVTPPATQTVAGTVAITSTSTQSITAVQATAANLNVTAALAASQTITAIQATAANLNVTAAIAAAQTITALSSAIGSTGATAPTTAIENGLLAATVYPAAVTGGQLVAQMGDKAGRAAVVVNSPRDLIGWATLSAVTTAATGILTAAAASFYDITELIFTTTMTTGATVTLSDGVTSYPINLAPSGGIAKSFITPLTMGAAAATWTAALGAAGTVSCIVGFVKNK